MDSSWSNGGKWQGDFPPLVALRCGKTLLGILLGLLSCSRCSIADSSSINPSFWHLHDDEIRHTLLFSICYYFVISRPTGNKALIILRERNPSI
jgi:hypothetical protein